MTGIKVRIERNGKWENLDLDELSDAELDEFVEGKCRATAMLGIMQARDQGWDWVRSLAKWIRENVREGGTLT